MTATEEPDGTATAMATRASSQLPGRVRWGGADGPSVWGPSLSRPASRFSGNTGEQNRNNKHELRLSVAREHLKLLGVVSARQIKQPIQRLAPE